MKLPIFAKAAGLGSVMLLLTAGVASAAIATASVNVRTGPGIDYRVVDTLRPGEQVAIVDRDGSWCAVQKLGPNGWVACRFLGNSVRYRDDPRVSFSIGFGVGPDRPHRPPHGGWWGDHDHHHDHDHDGHWSGPGSFGLSFSN